MNEDIKNWTKNFICSSIILLSIVPQNIYKRDNKLRIDTNYGNQYNLLSTEEEFFEMDRKDIERLTKIETKIEEHDNDLKNINNIILEKFDKISNKFNSLEKEINEKFNSLEKELLKIKRDLHWIIGIGGTIIIIVLTNNDKILNIIKILFLNK